MVKAISPADLLKALTDGGEIALIDVRERACCARGRLLLSVNIPLSRFELDIISFVPRLTTRVVLHDDGEGMAEQAARVMEAGGYTDVSVLEGGVSSCSEVGFEMFKYHYVFTYAFGLHVGKSYATPEITPQALKKKVDAGEDLVILDTRQPPEFVHASIPGAINVPTTELIYQIKDLAPDPHTQVFVNCGAITRGVLGGQTLREAGLENPMQVVSNGVRGWFLAGYELARGTRSEATETTEHSKQWAREASERILEQTKIPFVTMADVERWRADESRTLFIVDVRTKDEYEAAHLADSVWILGSEVVGLYEDYMATRNARVCLVDDNETRAVVAASWLIRMGWPGVYVLKGGVLGQSLQTGPQHKAVLGSGPPSVDTITTTELATLIDTGNTLVLDFATSSDYENGHVPGAWWTIRSNLGRLASKLPPSQRIATTSPDGRIGAFAAHDLARLCNRPVATLAGGTNAWRQQGRTMVRGLTRTLGEIDDLLADVTVRASDDPITARDSARRMVDWQNQLLEKIKRDASFNFPDLGA